MIPHKAMLKLPHSLCRCTRLALENISHSYSTIVKQFANLSRKGKTCVALNYLGPSQFVSNSFHLRLLSNIKKRLRSRRSSANLSAIKKHKQMSNSMQPTVTNYCCGGQFEISPEDGTSNERSSNFSDDNKKIYMPPDFRIWEPVEKINASNEGFKFRVMSYNVLAQYLLECHPYLYTGCSSQNLKWRVRAAKIYDEILSLSPDILCLQEVQVSHLNTFYRKFEELGYCGIFKQKTGQREDGCAIYFKKSLFDIQDHLSVEFYQPEMAILNRDNIGLIVKLAPRCSASTPIVVATTHLLFNPKRTDVRLAQLQVLLAEIDRFAYCGDGRESSYLPIILTGDFNSTPESTVVKLLDRGHVRASSFRDNSDWKKIGVTDNCQHLAVYLNRQRGVATDFTMIKIHNSEHAAGAGEQAADPQRHQELFNSNDLAHPLALESVYQRVKSNGQCEATTFQGYWVTVDYIYFSSHSSLRLLERLRLPTAAECEALGMLPNDRLGSDHLALAATFQLKQKSSL